MERRHFSKLMGTGIALPALSTAAAAPKGIKAAMITEAGGAHQNFYLEALGLAEEVSSVSLCDPSGKSEAMARKLLGGKLTGSYRDLHSLLSKEKPDLALITMEGVTSPPAIEAALDAGCQVLAEKPGCVRVEDFDRLQRKAKARNLNLILALGNRVDPVMVEARRLVREGKIGKIYGAELHLIADQTRLGKPGYRDSWFAQKARAGGGHLIWLGIHWIDLAMYVTGLQVQTVTGFIANAGGQPLDVEDSAAVAMQFNNGSLGTLMSGYYLDKGYHSHLKVWGAQGWLQVHKHGGIPLEWYSTLEPNPQVRRWEYPKRAVGDVYPIFVRAVARACAGLEPYPVTGDDSLRALKTVFACYRAAQSGQTQRI